MSVAPTGIRAAPAADRPGALPPPTSSTPTLRAAARRSRFWIVIALGAILVAVAATILQRGAAAEGPALGADNPAPAGGMALAEVLRQQGVTVIGADSIGDVRAAASDNADATIFLFDETGFLPSRSLRQLPALAPRLVVASPNFEALRALAPGVGFAGLSEADDLGARCELPAADRAGSISPGGRTLRLTGAATGYTGCFPGGDGTYSVVERETDAGTTTLVAPTAVFSNDQITEYGNAALALGLLGQGDTLIWYLPTLADAERTGPPSLGELSPGWVTPVILLLIAVFVSGAIWRGRRFGPLVQENLPVVVQASETMEGRARLYARSSARLRATDALRVGAVGRLSRQAGLPGTADMDELVQTVASLTGQPIARIRAVLLDDVPTTDRDLLRLSSELEKLERDVARATDPTSGSSSHERMDP